MPAITWKHADQPDDVLNDAANFKANMDSQSEAARTYINDTLLTELARVTDGSSGADNIGMTPNASTGTSNTAQTIVDKLAVMTTQGDITYQGVAAPARLAKGTAYQHLGMNTGATAPEWQASLQSLITAAGDTIYGSGANTPAKLAKGTAGQIYTMNSGATAPEWSGSWAAWTPTLTWTTATPTVSSTISRHVSIGKTCFFDIQISCSDGKGATNLTISLPVAPKNTGSTNMFIALIQINGVNSAPICAGDTSTDYVIFLPFPTLTNAQGAVIIVSGQYELA